MYFPELDDDFWAFEPKGRNQENQVAPVEKCCGPLQLLTYVHSGNLPQGPLNKFLWSRLLHCFAFVYRNMVLQVMLHVI